MREPVSSGESSYALHIRLPELENPPRSQGRSEMMSLLLPVVTGSRLTQWNNVKPRRSEEGGSASHLTQIGKISAASRSFIFANTATTVL